VTAAPCLEVEAAGLLTTVQDTRGRSGLERYGVPTGGALDWSAATAANALVGNPPDAALLELTLVGPTLRFPAPTAFALAGADLGAELDGRPVPPGWSWLARTGSRLSFGGRRRGARAYLGVAGGLRVPAVLGSHAADVRAGFSGLAGRALRAGDRLPIAPTTDAPARSGWHLPGPDQDPDAAVRVLPGPHIDRFAAGTLDEFCAATWEISDQADRMGYRLRGPALRHVRGADVASLGLPLGAVQVTGDGRPIVLLADHQPTGGYTVLACVIRADVPLLAQRAPAETVRFALTTPAEARAALCARHAALRAVDPDAAAWAGLRQAGRY
jgi:biotin-dependent carboxylase-like uncharacterized protein